MGEIPLHWIREHIRSSPPLPHLFVRGCPRLSVQIAKEFFKKNGLDHVNLSTADGALEAAPAVRFGRRPSPPPLPLHKVVAVTRLPSSRPAAHPSGVAGESD